MSHSSYSGPARRNLGMVGAEQIAASGRREEVQRLRAIVGPPPASAPAMAGQGRTAAKKARAGSGQAGPVRKPGKHVPQAGNTAKKAAGPKARGPLRIDRSNILPRLSAGEKAAALAALAVMFPHRTFAGLQELLAQVRREARHDVGAANFLAEITGKTPSVQASGPVMSFARQRPLWGARLDRLVRYGGDGR